MSDSHKSDNHKLDNPGLAAQTIKKEIGHIRYKIAVAAVPNSKALMPDLLRELGALYDQQAAIRRKLRIEPQTN